MVADVKLLKYTVILMKEKIEVIIGRLGLRWDLNELINYNIWAMIKLCPYNLNVHLKRPSM